MATTGSGISHAPVQKKHGDLRFREYVDTAKSSVVVVTDDYTALVNSESIICNKATAMTVTLLVAGGSGNKLNISNIGVGTVTIDADGTDTIDDELTQEITQWDNIVIEDYVANKWKIK